MEQKPIMYFKVTIDEVVPNQLANIFRSIESDSRFEVRKIQYNEDEVKRLSMDLGVSPFHFIFKDDIIKKFKEFGEVMLVDGIDLGFESVVLYNKLNYLGE